MKVHHHTLEGFKNEVLRRGIRQVRKDYYQEGDSAELDVSGRKSRIAYTVTVLHLSALDPASREILYFKTAVDAVPSVFLDSPHNDEYRQRLKEKVAKWDEHIAKELSGLQILEGVWEP